MLPPDELESCPNKRDGNSLKLAQLVPPKSLRQTYQRHILSSAFRDRIQVDLIDMRTCRRKDLFGVIMNCTVVCKDHFTGFFAARCIPRKHASYVAHVLSELFGIIGYPTILPTDNGKEFTGQPILDLLNRNAPLCTTAAGRPRTPETRGP
jgi:hypothetical protein